MKGKINGIGFEADKFFYDGCHKIYLGDTREGCDGMFASGWTQEEVYPIELLPQIWASTCPLRFILSADLGRTFVAQCEPAEFEGWELEGWLEEELAEMKREQIEANGKWEAANA